MTQFVFANFAESTLDHAISGSETVLDVADLGRFPTIPNGQTLALILTDGKQDPEIVYATAYADGSFTVQRGMEGTTAKAWMRGTAVFHSLTAASILWFSTGGESEALGDLADDIAAIAERLDADEADIAALQASMAGINETITTVLGPYTLTVAQIQQAFADLDAAYVLLQTTITARVDNVEAGLTTVQQSLVSLEGSITTDLTQLTSRMDDAEADILQEAQTRADADSATATLTTQLRADLDDTTAAYSSLATVVSDNYAALTTLTTDLTADLADTNASVTTESLARADGDAALASDITTLSAHVDTVEGDITAMVTDEATARADADSALADTITTLSAHVDTVEGDLTATITDEATARADGDTALATDITTLTSRADDIEASVTTVSDTLADLSGNVGGHYGIYIDANGVWAAFDLMAGTDAGAGTSVSEAKFGVDQFVLATPDGDKQPFFFDVGNGWAYLDNVRINGADILDATIGSAAIENAAIHNAHIDTAAVETIHITGAAVTNPVYAFTGASTTITGTTVVTLQSLTFTTTGELLVIDGSTSLGTGGYGISGGSANFYFYFYQDATLIYSAVAGTIFELAGFDEIVIASLFNKFTVQPAAGTYTFTLKCVFDTASGSPHVPLSNRQLSVTEIKR